MAQDVLDIPVSFFFANLLHRKQRKCGVTGMVFNMFSIKLQQYIKTYQMQPTAS